MDLYCLGQPQRVSTTVITKKTRNKLTVIQTTLYKSISGNIKRTIMADPILELAGLGLFCYSRFINHICKLDCKVVWVNYN